MYSICVEYSYSKYKLSKILFKYIIINLQSLYYYFYSYYNMYDICVISEIFQNLSTFLWVPGFQVFNVVSFGAHRYTYETADAFSIEKGF